MNIALFTDTFYPIFGGTETVVKILAEEYLKLGHNVMVFTGDFCKKNIDDSEFKFKVVRSKSFHIGFGEFVTYPNSKLFTKELDKFKPDVIHAHTPFKIGTWGIRYGKKNNIKTVLTIHTRFNYSYELHAPFSKRNVVHKAVVNALTSPVKTCVSIADEVTTVSSSSAEEDIKRIYGYGKAVNVVRNGFNYAENTRLSQSWMELLDKKKFVLCFAGRVDITKNIEFSLLVCKQLKERDLPFEFNLYGSGKDIKKYEKIAKKYGIADEVKFCGKKNFTELLNAYRRSDVFLFPSIFDTDGLVCIESRSCGCPTLVVKDTGAAERIQEGCNGFALSYSVDAFASKIEDLYKLKQTRFEEYCKLRDSTMGIKVDSWEVISNEYIKLYKEL